MINLMIKEMCLSVCLCGVYRHTWDFSLIWRSPLPLKGYKFWSMLGVYGHWAVRVLKHATHARHTYYDTDLPFLIDIFEVPWHTHLLPRVWQWSCHYLLLRLVSVAIGDRTPISSMRGELSTCEPPQQLITVNDLPLPVQFFFLI